MKLLRQGPAGAEKPGMLDIAGKMRDLSGILPDTDGAALSNEGPGALRALNPETPPLVDPGTRLGTCVAGTGKFICIGLNYADYAAESGMAVPPEPIIFMKATSAICGPDDPIILPRTSTKTDWDVELAVIIGTRANYVNEDTALDHVAGYAVANDISERAFQTERSGQWTKGKSRNNFGQLGPWLVTRDAPKNPQDLALWLKLNGETMQNGSTGTPPGVGMGQKAPCYLKAGDVVELGIAGLGQQRQTVVDDRA